MLIEFSKIKSIALKTENKLLKNINLFDVYSGNSLPIDKKSYAVRFTLESFDKTLTDKEIDNVMQRLIHAFELKLNAKVRM